MIGNHLISVIRHKYCPVAKVHTNENDIRIVLHDARLWIEERARELPNDKLAIVLDIDETSLSNWARIYKDDFAYIPNGLCNIDESGTACGDLAWQASRRAPAIEPTLQLYRFARCLQKDPEQPICKPIEVFFVTGRREGDTKIDEMTPTEWTLENLKKVGFSDVAEDHLYMRARDSSGPVSVHKIAARKKIETNYKIIANIGDQQSDLIGDKDGAHADRAFKVPNPFYFIQ